MADPALPNVGPQVRELIEAAGITGNVDQITEILATGIRLGQDGTDRLDLKITAAFGTPAARCCTTESCSP